MKDFDFDEIDRAVSSVNADVPVLSDDIKNTTTEQTADQPAKSATPTPTSALAGRRSSGRFMDVVHPSSNMRQAPLKMPERPLPQTSQSLTSDKPPITSTPITTNMPVNQPEKTELPTPTVPYNDWSGSKNEDEDDIDKISDDISNELEHKSDESLETPFISGTKVEKRPLGAFSAEIEPKKDESLPDELQGKLLSIESNESIANPEEDSYIKITAQEPVDNPKANPQAVDNNPVAATSITQQYEEKPSSGDKNSGAIYDTDSYHKALIHPIKKKTGWMWIVWILVIIVAGIGAGVVVFNYVLPNL
jgi:hypothetical protein